MMDTLYLAVETLYILKVFFDGVIFTIPWPWNYENIIRILLCAVVFLRLTQIGIHFRKICVLAVFCCVMYKLSWAAAGYAFLLDIALFIIGAIGISYRKILKTGFLTGVFVLVFAMLGSFIGCIPDLVYPDYAHGAWQFRHSFGIVYPTDFSAHVTFLVLTGWVLYGGKMPVLSAISALGFAFFTYYYCKAKCSTAILCLLAIVILYCFLTEKLAGKHHMLHRAAKHIDIFAAYIMPICAFTMIGLTLFYTKGNDFMGKLDAALTHRLLLGWDAIVHYGIHPFGSTFALIGSGGTTAHSGSLKYNFIDSSYVLILVRYGFMTLSALLAQSIYMGRKLIKNGHRRLILAAALVALHSMIEHHLPEVAYNLFLLLPFADFAEKETAITQSRNIFRINSPSKRKRVFILYSITATGGFLIVMVFPRLITWLKTLADIYHVTTPGQHGLLIGVFCIGIWMGAMLIWPLSHIAPAFVDNSPVSPKRYVAIGVLVLSCLSAFATGEYILRKGKTQFQNLIDADRPIIEALLSKGSAAGKLYVGHFPQLYKREFAGISEMALGDESLAGHTNATLIAEDSGELHSLMLAGYEYGALPSGHGIYTNNKTAKNILEENGVILTPYYSSRKTVNLKELAISNSLSLSSDGTLLLNGPGYSLRHGPNATIYAGTLRVTYRLRLLNNPPSHETVAAAIITSDWGQAIWNQQDIYLDEFDKDGKCVFIIDTALTNDCPNMDFQLIAMEGVELELEAIEYEKQMPTTDGPGGKN